MDLSTLLLTSLTTYGVWALGAATLISGLGLPLPASMLLLAAGAFMRQGTLNWQAGVLLAAFGAIAGDMTSYLMGRYGGTLALGGWAHTPIWQQAQGVFARWGGLTVFLSRFILTPIALPVNLIAGSTHYTPWRFLSSVVLGELVWVLGFSSLGYLFADQWSALSTATGSVSSWILIGAVILVGGVYLVRRFWPRRLLTAAR